MGQSKMYSIIFTGKEAEKAQDLLRIYFVDGGGEDMIIESLAPYKIEASKVASGTDYMIFTAKAKAE